MSPVRRYWIPRSTLVLVSSRRCTTRTWLNRPSGGVDSTRWDSATSAVSSGRSTCTATEGKDPAAGSRPELHPFFLADIR